MERRGKPFSLSVLRLCILETKRRNLTAASSLFFVTSTRSGQGMVHDTQLSASYRAVRSCSCWRYAGGQSTGSANFGKRSNLFARRSISFWTGSSI